MIIDHQLITEEEDLNKVWAKIPNLNSWRTFTAACGSFPKDLSAYEIGDHFLRRSDWLSWKLSYLSATARKPTFSDYTIQHPYFAEPPAHANFSASIRYTLNSEWLIMRGQGVFVDGGPGFKQWPALAELLCGKEEFCVEGFSSGDQYIAQMGAQQKVTGSAETWIRAGMNHHMAFVLRQVEHFREQQASGRPGSLVRA